MTEDRISPRTYAVVHDTRYDYAHPVFDEAASQAQARLGDIQGRQRTWFAGAWAGYGFHEDGFKAGTAAAEGVLADSLLKQRAEGDAALLEALENAGMQGEAQGLFVVGCATGAAGLAQAHAIQQAAGRPAVVA